MAHFRERGAEQAGRLTAQCACSEDSAENKYLSLFRKLPGRREMGGVRAGSIGAGAYFLISFVGGAQQLSGCEHMVMWGVLPLAALPFSTTRLEADVEYISPP